MPATERVNPNNPYQEYSRFHFCEAIGCESAAPYTRYCYHCADDAMQSDALAEYARKQEERSKARPAYVEKLLTLGLILFLSAGMSLIVWFAGKTVFEHVMREF